MLVWKWHVWEGGYLKFQWDSSCLLPDVTILQLNTSWENQNALNGQWAAFLKDPADSRLRENKGFHPLEWVFADITQHAHDIISAQGVSSWGVGWTWVQNRQGQCGEHGWGGGYRHKDQWRKCPNICQPHIRPGRMPVDQMATLYEEMLLLQVQLKVNQNSYI